MDIKYYKITIFYIFILYIDYLLKQDESFSK